MQDERDLHAARLSKFHAQVDDKRTEWRTIQTYEDVHDLREYALVIGRTWRGYTPLAAAQGKFDTATGETGSQLHEEQLGRLGRESQHGALRKLLSGLAAYPDVPAVAVLLHGDKDEGQRAFVAYVLDTLLRHYYPKRKIGRLPAGNNTVEALVAWVAGTLGLTKVSSIDTPEALAERVVEELKHEQLHFVIDRVGADYAGGVTAFQQAFWQPFWTRLKLLRSQQQIANRLVAIVTDYSGGSGNWAYATVDAKPGVPIDFSKLIRAPRLGHIEASDLYDWLEELEVPDSPAGRRVELAQRALKDEESGASDGTPLHVFERLKGEPLWPEGDDS
jgi:inactive STAND